MKRRPKRRRVSMVEFRIIFLVVFERLERHFLRVFSIMIRIDYTN